jgi:hypothetical protein
MKRPTTKHIVIYAAIGALAAIAFIVFSNIANGESAKNNVEHTKINDSAQKTDVETTVTAPEGAQAVENEKTYVDSSSTPNQRVETPVQQESGGHIPFTNEPVVSGQPESYVGTVGQCPFYEMAGEKGCYPPSDIECNADWSVCTKKGDQ